MPALMSYVSYVAQSKARDEIVNNVTFEISSQKNKLQGVLDHIANIEALINADDEKIGEISGIITDYTNSVLDILSPDFNQEDLNQLNSNSLLRQFKGDYNEFIEHQRGALEPVCEKKSVAEAMYSATVDIMWNKIEHWKDAGTDEIDGKKIDQLYTTYDFKSVANQISKQRVEQAAHTTYGQLTKLNKEVKTIVDRRQDMLRQESNKCRERLVKEHITLELPLLPEFEFSSTMPRPSEVIVRVGSIDFELYDKLSVLFERKFWKNIGTFFSLHFNKSSVKTVKDYKLKFSFTKTEFMNLCEDKLKDSFKTAVYENDIADVLRKELSRSVIDSYMNSLINELKGAFERMNSIYKEYIERFRSAVDDRDKYKAEIELYNLRKANISSIGECTKELMDTWNFIIRDFIEDEDTENSSVLV